MKKRMKEPKWTEISPGRYRSNMTTAEMNAYQKRTGKRINPPGFDFSLF